MPKVIEFPKAAAQWVSSRDCVRFYALVDGRVIPCFVTLEALMDHFPVGPVDPQGFSSLDAFRQNRSAIELVARQKIEASESERTSEVLLRSGDFPPTSAIAPAHRIKYLTSSESPEIRGDPAILSKVDQVNSILEADYVRRSMRITAEWDFIPTSGEPLVQLTLKDDDTKASINTLFTRDDLASLITGPAPLSRIWSSLLSAKTAVLSAEYARLSQEYAAAATAPE